MAYFGLSDLVSSGDDSSSDDSSSSDSGFLGTLTGLAQSTVQSVGQAASEGLTSAVSNAINPVRSSNTAPSPDLAAKAATPSATFTNATIAGVSLPIVLVGLGALLYFSSHK